jgi:hypothetical protein
MFGRARENVECSYVLLLELEPVELKMMQFCWSTSWCASLSSLDRLTEASLYRGVFSLFPIVEIEISMG